MLVVLLYLALMSVMFRVPVEKMSLSKTPLYLSQIQHRCVAIFKDKVNKPTGFALGSIEGRVAIHYINPPNP